MTSKGLFYELFFFASGKTLRDKKKVSFVNQEPTVIEQQNNFMNVNRMDNNNDYGFENQDVDSAVNSENLEMEINETHTIQSESESV